MTSRFFGTLLTITLAAPAQAAGHRASPIEVDTSDRAKQLNLEGQRQFNEQNFDGAAASWTRILEVLPENATNREERDNTLLIALEAYKESARRVGQGAGQAAAKREVDVLRKAIAVRDGYVEDFGRAYGGRETVSNPVVESGAEVERMLADAERRAGASASVAPPIVTPSTPVDVPTFHAPRGPSGNGLIAGGAVLIALGLGSTSMIIIGAMQAKDARREYRDAQSEMDDDGMDKADRKGRRANGLIAGGAVMTGVFLAAGGTMLGIGIRRRVRYQAFMPVVGPQYVGLGWTGRF
jgi:hypothetical protein